MKSNSISIIICTKDRPKQLLNCLTVISQDVVGGVEIVIVDQSKNDDIKGRLAIFKGLRINYFCTFSKGLGMARNIGIKMANGNILCFIDDDCIVSEKWLSKIDRYFTNNPKTLILFGKVLPFLKTNKGKNYFCPSTSVYSSEKVVKLSNFNRETDFFTGNNMIIRKKLFTKIGTFKNWLGVGTLASGGEELEFILRCLYGQVNIAYSPSILVYHDRWIDKLAFEHLMERYFRSVIAVKSYYEVLGIKKVYIPGIFDSYINDVRRIKQMNIHLFANKKTLRNFKEYILGVFIGKFNGYVEK